MMNATINLVSKEKIITKINEALNVLRNDIIRSINNIEMDVISTEINIKTNMDQDEYFKNEYNPNTFGSPDLIDDRSMITAICDSIPSPKSFSIRGFDIPSIPSSWFISVSPWYPEGGFQPGKLVVPQNIGNYPKSFPIDLLLCKGGTIDTGKDYFDIETDLTIEKICCNIEKDYITIDSLSYLMPNINSYKPEPILKTSKYKINWGNINHKTNFELLLDNTRNKIRSDNKSKKTHRGKGTY